HLIVAEGRARLRSSDADGVEERCFAVDDAHAASAAAARSLDDHRITDVTGDAQVLLRVITQGAVRARDARHPVRLHHSDRGHLVTHGANGLRPGTYEHEAA